ncbi:DUF481 domain-containing protein, partial [Arthrospira platensis SPKY1]|nr:DUF481 domain-containing protein [Arthrospira platensis SPKY1]
MWLVVPVVAFAQLNPSDTLRWKADLATTGFWQAGNVHTVIFRAKTEITIEPIRHWVFKTTNSYVYQEFGRVKADEDILSLNFLSYKPTQRVYPVLLGFVSTNFRRDIDRRTLLGAGLTLDLLQAKNAWLKVALSSELEHTAFGTSAFNRARYNGQTRINTVRGTLWVNGRYDVLPKRLILNHQSYIQPSLEARDNYRWQADLGLEMP